MGGGGMSLSGGRAFRAATQKSNAAADGRGYWGQGQKGRRRGERDAAGGDWRPAADWGQNRR